MSKEPDYELEYVYTKKSFKKAMWLFVGLWVLTRIARAIFYVTTGVALFDTSGLTLAIVLCTGAILGAAIMYSYVFFKSVRVEALEKEKSRLMRRSQKN